MTTLAERLLRSLESGRRSRVTLAILQELVLELEPALRTSPLKRDRLAEALDEGQRTGRLRLPAKRRLYAGQPPLPAWVVVVRETKAAATVSGQAYFWRPELAWADELRLRPDELERLRRVNAWLRDLDPNEPVVPVRERSLELFGDEKVLDRVQGGRLFFDGRLTLDLLRARIVHPPFVYQRISKTTVLLVIENHHMYDSFARLLAPDSRVGVVAYGAGTAFIGSVTYARELRPAVEDIRYFGDIDARGLRIPAEADQARGESLPHIRPAERLYRLLIQVGVRGAAPPVSAEAAARLASWLPADLREEVATMLTGGWRMAQEAVGLKVLRDRPEVL